jgi:hypothetical protein
MWEGFEPAQCQLRAVAPGDAELRFGGMRTVWRKIAGADA